MAEHTTTQEWTRMMENTARQAADVAGVWTEANRRALDELAGLTTGLAKENARLVGELTHVALDAALETQRAAIRWQTSWPEVFADPVRWYQRTLIDGVEGTQRAMGLLGMQARMIMQCADRVQDMTRQAGQRLRDAWTSAATRAGEAARRVA